MTPKAELAIQRAKENNNFKGAIKLLSEYYEAQHKAEWEKKISDEYYGLFPLFREPTEDEKKAQYEMFVSIAEEKHYDIVPYEEFEADKIPIDYSDNEDYITLEEYKNETRVVKEATEFEPEVTELVRPYVPMEKEALMLLVDNYLKPAREEIARKKKKETLEKLQVELDNIKFDANVNALGNMNAVVNLANWNFNKLLANGIAPEDAYEDIYINMQIKWKTADNNVVPITIEVVCNALEKGIKTVAEIVGVE